VNAVIEHLFRDARSPEFFGRLESDPVLVEALLVPWSGGRNLRPSLRPSTLHEAKETDGSCRVRGVAYTLTGLFSHRT